MFLLNQKIGINSSDYDSYIYLYGDISISCNIGKGLACHHKISVQDENDNTMKVF